MSIKLSDLFGKDVFSIEGQKVGKVFDLVINLEKGRIETMTTEPLKARSKQEAKKIISDKSIPYGRVVSVKDIIIVSSVDKRKDEAQQQQQQEQHRPSYKYSFKRRSA